MKTLFAILALLGSATSFASGSVGSANISQKPSAGGVFAAITGEWLVSSEETGLRGERPAGSHPSEYSRGTIAYDAQNDRLVLSDGAAPRYHSPFIQNVLSGEPFYQQTTSDLTGSEIHTTRVEIEGSARHLEVNETMTYSEGFRDSSGKVHVRHDFGGSQNLVVRVVGRDKIEVRYTDSDVYETIRLVRK